MLVQWADACVEKSVNQPILPHVIIILNAANLGTEAARWEITDTTKEFLESAQEAYRTDPELFEFAGNWRTHRRRKIDNISDLLSCYYSSVKVVRIPQKSPQTYVLIDQQVAKLRAEIEADCAEAHRDKGAARRLSDVDMLNEYLQAGFDHFATNFNVPFDFKQVALRNRPIPIDLGDHVVNLAKTLQKSDPDKSGPAIFQKISTMLISCILLDIVRQKRQGKPLVNKIPHMGLTFAARLV